PPTREPGEGEAYDISGRLPLAYATRPYERSGEEPLYRRLPVFTLDASARQAEGRIVDLKIPYEPLRRGLRGRILEVEAEVPGEAALRRADLDDPHVLIAGGYPPSISDPRFHEQMVYAVAMQTYGQFQTALGRQPAWAFDRRDEENGLNRLRLRPFGAPGEAQAWYDHDAGEVVFGHFRPTKATPSVPNREGSHVYLSL
ncbi:peptidase M4, partial [Amaricoccus sp. HAR-UPW-R2A-40]